MMDNKFVRYCIIEPKCRMRMVILFSLVAIIAGQIWYGGTLDAKLSTLNDRSTVITQIVDMERELKTKARLEAFRNDNGDTSGSVQFSQISGVAMHGGKPSVLIDGVVYVEGSTFGEYDIVKITQEMITLVNKKTNARKNLYVFE